MQLASINPKIKGAGRGCLGQVEGMLGPGGGVAVGPMGKFIGEKKLDFLDGIIL